VRKQEKTKITEKGGIERQKDTIKQEREKVNILGGNEATTLKKKGEGISDQAKRGGAIRF